MLTADLGRLGVSAGDTVLLHVSVKSIGWLVGGPDIIILALEELLGADGTLMMYAGWEDGPYTMDGWPAEKQAAYRRECPPFDPLTSRAVVDWSIVAEILRKWPGTMRSNHPDGSFCARGRQADYLTAGHPLRYGYGAGSPLARFVELGGKVLNVGAPLNTTTLLHHAEDRAALPHKRIVTYQMPVRAASGEIGWVEIEEFDTSDGIVDGYEGDYFSDLMEAYLAAREIGAQKIGRADSYLFDAADLHRFAVGWIEENLASLG